MPIPRRILPDRCCERDFFCNDMVVFSSRIGLRIIVSLRKASGYHASLDTTGHWVRSSDHPTLPRAANGLRSGLNPGANGLAGF
jgi:hypothetical protein